MFLIYGKSPLYSTFGMSLGILALSLYIKRRMAMANILASLSLAVDWTSLPLSAPVLFGTIKERKFRMLFPYALTLVVYVFWLKSFLGSASYELSQRFPDIWDILGVAPLSFIRIVIFGGPCFIPIIFKPRTLFDDTFKSYLGIQMLFLLLWADFYINHVPYLFNFLPFLSLISANIIKNIRHKPILMITGMLYSMALLWVMLYPYRIFYRSKAHCVIENINEAKVYVDLPDEDKPSLKVMLTLIKNITPRIDEAQIVLSYDKTGNESFTLMGDTIYMQGELNLKRCKDDTTKLDRIIFHLRIQVMAFLRNLMVNFKHIFKRPATVMYPDRLRDVPERWRLGGFALTLNPETGEENCIGCQLCQNICPSQIITVVRGVETSVGPDGKPKKKTFAKEFYLDFQACMQCELCVQVCPTDAIVMVKERRKPGYTREDLLYDKDRLIENGKRILKGELEVSWITGNRIRELQNPKRA